MPKGRILHRVHRSHYAPLHFGCSETPDSRQRWDSPDASYGVCYMAEDDHIALAETMLRAPELAAVSESELKARSLATLRLRSPLRLAAMHGSALHPHGADASVVQGPYPATWVWSAALYSHPDNPDGICYRARHDDSGFGIALFERASDKLEHLISVELLDPSFVSDLSRWLDRYEVGLTS